MTDLKINLIDDDSLKLKVADNPLKVQITEPDVTNLKIQMVENEPLTVKLAEDESLKIQMQTAPTVGADNYNNLINKPQINNVTLVGNKTSADLGLDIVHIDTTEHWNAQRNLTGQKGHLYVYTDYEIINGVPVPAFKIGDGKAYLIDAPFVDGNMTTLTKHINDSSVHITDEERAFWNDKVTCFLSQDNTEILVFSQD